MQLAILTKKNPDEDGLATVFVFDEDDAVVAAAELAATDEIDNSWRIAGLYKCKPLRGDPDDAVYQHFPYHAE